VNRDFQAKSAEQRSTIRQASVSKWKPNSVMQQYRSDWTLNLNGAVAAEAQRRLPCETSTVLCRGYPEATST
ncbi:hypothetical protein KIN20_032399, partial [Parelaphostrongylus tenuis]